MISAKTFYFLLYIWILFGILLFPLLLRIRSPYGKHFRAGWGPKINNKTGWVLMELPALLVFAYFFLQGFEGQNFITWLFFLLWMFHYFNRVFIYPFRTKTKGKQMPVLIMLFSLVFNFINGFFNGYYFGTITEGYQLSWLYDPRFIAGFLLFFTGMAINRHSDKQLLNLRSKNENGYKIPFGRLFNFISCPNFFGEIIEWIGFAVMTWCLPAFAFALWTAINLVPRALDHHKWYRQKFSDYPAKRKAVFPFLL